MRKQMALATMAGLTAVSLPSGLPLASAQAASRGPAPSLNLIPEALRAHQSAGHAAVTAGRSYTVRPGDTLSALAARLLGGERYWPLLWWANKHAVPDPDLITPGQVLTVPPGSMTLQMEAAAYRALPHAVTTTAKVTTAAPAADGDGDHDGDTSDAAQPAPAAPAGPVSVSGMSAYEQCVITRESGGNPGIWNATGHWGLFQFSSSTWYAAGAAPGTFGSAGASYQEQIFLQAFARWGTQPWSPSDGC